MMFQLSGCYLISLMVTRPGIGVLAVGVKGCAFDAL